MPLACLCPPLRRVPQSQAALATGYPVALGIFLHESFHGEEVVETGRVPMPAHGEKNLGGHAVVCCGYDEEAGHWIMRNSWGPHWGDKGYFYLPMPYLCDKHLATVRAATRRHHGSLRNLLLCAWGGSFPYRYPITAAHSSYPCRTAGSSPRSTAPPARAPPEEGRDAVWLRRERTGKVSRFLVTVRWGDAEGKRLERLHG